MAIDSPYYEIVVESYNPVVRTGKRGKTHLRPAPGQRFPTDLDVSGARSMTTEYPSGSKFLLLVKLTDREGGGQYLYSNPRLPYKVVEPG